LTTVMVALMLAFNRRRTAPHLRVFFDLGTLGYALPGSVLAVGLMLCFVLLDREVIAPLQGALGLVSAPVLLGSVGALVVAYCIRFLAVASGPLQASLERIGDNIPEAAASLGAKRWRLLRHIYLPMLRPGLLTAAVLVLVDVMKEMPATLLLRPFGWDTLAVRVYEMTSEGEWQRAALPALTLVVVGLVPVVLALRQSSAGR
jgi:iron(III) transport system permease protein